MLDQDQRITKVAEVPQRPQEPVVVSGMQPNRRLVEDVENAGQSAADLAGQPDALALAAGECGRPSGQIEIIEADINQKGQPVAHFAHQIAGNVLLVGIEVEVLEERLSLPQRPTADLIQREPLEPDGRGIVAQPRAHASGAGNVLDHSLKLVPIHKRNPPRLLDRWKEPLVLKGQAALSVG